MDHFNYNYDFLKKPEFQLLKPSDNNLCCNDIMLNILSGKIMNNFKDPIKYLYSIYQNDYYKNLLEIVENKKEIFNIPINIKRTDIDEYDKEIFLRYIESNVKYNLIISSKKLDIEYDIFYELNNLTEKQVIGIIFQIEFLKTPLQKYFYYKDKSEKYNKNIYCYYCKKDIIKEDCYMIDNFNNIREISQVIFNDLSIEILDLLRLDRLLYYKFDKTFYNHNIYKRLLYNYINLTDQIRFLLFSCSSMFSLGMTYCKDIDLLVYDKNIGKGLDLIIDKYLSKLQLIDLHIKGYGEWKEGGKKEYLNDWFEYEWPNLYGSKNLEETIFNPKYHFYFLGLKIINYKADIARRIKRNRPSSYTDLIMLDYFNGMIITPDKLERDYWVNNNKKTYSDDELLGLIIIISKYIIRWHGIKISAKRIYDYILFPSDFKLTDEQLKEIDNENDNWIIKKGFKMEDFKENMLKRKIIIKK